MNAQLDYESLKRLAQKKAELEAGFMYPFWAHKERQRAYEMLAGKYYLQYTRPTPRAR